MTHVAAQDIGTTAILLLVAVSIVIRARYFCTYGREAFAVVVAFIFCVAPVRYSASHEWISPATARTLIGWFGLAFLLIQLDVLRLAELMRRREQKAEHFVVTVEQLAGVRSTHEARRERLIDRIREGFSK